jgi:hypothetical protein
MKQTETCKLGIIRPGLLRAFEEQRNEEEKKKREMKEERAEFAPMGMEIRAYA